MTDWMKKEKEVERLVISKLLQLQSLVLLETVILQVLQWQLQLEGQAQLFG